MARELRWAIAASTGSLAMGGTQFLVEERFWDAQWLLPWISYGVVALMVISVVLWAHLGWEWWRGGAASGLIGGVSFGRIPLQDAARRAYEAAERADALNLLPDRPSSPEVPLTSFKYVFIVDDEAEFSGVKAPSTETRKIPRSELGSLYPVDGLSQLNYKTPHDRVAYTNVTIRRKDLKRAIPQFIAQSRRLADRFRSH